VWRFSALDIRRHFSAVNLSVFTWVLLLLCDIASAAGTAPLLPLRIGPHAFEVELAATPEQHQRGLMGRTHLAADGGMLFVFDQSDRHCFWMKDTPLPLSIAFIDSAGRIVSLADMQPRSETLHCPPTDIRYTLEVKQGTFRQRGIAPGARVDGLPR
jgi:hypothetical protein